MTSGYVAVSPETVGAGRVQGHETDTVLAVAGSVMLSSWVVPPAEKVTGSDVAAKVKPAAVRCSVGSMGTQAPLRRIRTGAALEVKLNVPSGWARTWVVSVVSWSTATGLPVARACAAAEFSAALVAVLAVAADVVAAVAGLALRGPSQRVVGWVVTGCAAGLFAVVALGAGAVGVGVDAHAVPDVANVAAATDATRPAASRRRGLPVPGPGAVRGLLSALIIARRLANSPFGIAGNLPKL
jgi:hypothetical protein